MAELGAGAGSGYPAAIDTKQTFLNTGSPLSDGPTRMDAEVLNDALGALVAIEAELGIAPSGVWATVVARLDAFLGGSVAIPQLLVAGVGPHAIGGATTTNMALRLTGALAGAAFALAADFLTLTPSVTSDAAGLLVNALTITKAAFGTHGRFAAVDVRTFTVGAGAAVLANAASVFIEGAPTGATNNYALWVAAGNIRVGSDNVGRLADTTKGPSIAFADAQLLFRSGTSHFQWNNQANALERMRLTDAGILLIGTTVLGSAITGDLVFKNGFSIWGETAAGGALLQLMRLDTGNALVFSPGGSTQVSFRDEILINSGFLHFLTEIADPAAPSANTARLYIKDNGAGKTQLVVRFNTGAVQQIAIEP